jgi:hypothetical protein
VSWTASAPRNSVYGLRRAARLVLSAAATAAALAAAATLGALTAIHRTYGLVGATLLALAGLALADPLLVAVAAFPGTVLVQRASGGAGAGLSLSDLVIVAASAIAVTRIHWSAAPTLRRSIVPIAAFEALLLLTVAAHPNIHDSLEWGHRIFMLAGSLAVGWVVAVSGRARQAVTALLVASLVLALIVLEHAIALHFKPAQFGLYQKNFIGASMWMAFMIAHLNPSWIGVQRRFARVAKYVFGLALLASQSKQAIIALMVVLVYSAIRHPSVRRRSKLLLAALVPLAVVGYFVIAYDVANVSVNRFNSIGVRLDVSFPAALHLWATSPVFGEGMRWFYLPRFIGYIQPPDIFVETLVAGGIVGMVALVVLLAGSARVFLSLPSGIGTIALVLVLGRAVEAIFDIYWASGGSTLPWLVAGLAIGTWDATLAARASMGAKVRASAPPVSTTTA